MQSGKSIINLPLLVGIALSVTFHVMALYSRGIYVPPEPQMESGRTVVQLTLIPAIASQSTPEPPPEPVKEPVEEPVPTPPEPIMPEPVPTPTPEPVVEPAPEATSKTAPESKEEEDAPPQEIPTAAELSAADSMEQNASQIEEKGVVTEASATSVIKPKYPRMSQRRNEEGNVMLRVQVLPSGKTGSIQITGSSGYKRLDEAAVKAVEKASFEPARKFGKAVESETEITITFKLTDE